MKFDHAVIYDGKFYNAGEEITEKVIEKPVDEKTKKETRTPAKK